MRTEATQPFFEKQETLLILNRAIRALAAVPPDSTVPAGLAELLSQALNFMASNPAKFDQYAALNVRWIGTSFLNEISRVAEPGDANRPIQISLAFALAYRFLCEFEFTQPGDPSHELSRVLMFPRENLNQFASEAQRQLVYASYTMPVNIAKHLLGDPAIAEFRNFSASVERSRKLQAEWDESLNKRQALLQALSANLAKATSEYNFVGLVKGFQNLRASKADESWWSFGGLLLAGVSMLIPPLTYLGYVLWNIDVIEQKKTTLVFALPTVLAIEVVLFYFFRVLLIQFKSVKAQLLQLDLRIALCQFIESYADYIANLRDKDPGALSKFESIVFSGLVADEGEIPSTFDGLEQLATLIKQLKSPD